ncbi:AAA family ATPase [Alicyclobacillus dauci]|uniref:MoxR family ATPase n=1 Tax=Alicyclobacillus dauci TaxID=1475485 RepID=A0ABY6Z374_9BACL|nr:MoxR family ATPase [Alicyclobacillus dauci]WAH36656.1 MoxR family ATPase [Alicyclobacillus dauci]
MADTTKAIVFDGWHPEIEPVVRNVQRVIVGKDDVIRLVMTALLAGGHCLIEDVPGVGKTMLVRATAKTLGCHFRRIQFTPDLLPSDVTGVSIYNQKTQSFEFRTGPIFGQVVLADEINRTSPKTQSALLQALEEHSVTADGEMFDLPQPFIVLATENPIEFEGTFPLPEAQLDRFLLKFQMGYPSTQEELKILEGQQKQHPIESIGPVVDPDTILRWRSTVRETRVDDQIARYIVELVQRTRSHHDVYLGASPRASLALFRAAQALAFIAGRTFVVPDDVRFLAPFVLGHRILLTADARLSGMNVRDIVNQLLQSVPVPTVQGVNK